MNNNNLFVNQYTGEVIDKRDYIEKVAMQRQKEGYKKYLAKGRTNPFYWGNMVNIGQLLKQYNITFTVLGGISALIQ
ncbi:hypothetical protein ACFOSP_17885 [Clostridium punense]|uniref:hypothetical protein n=1 Tax=Clostridium TaxID=1485 RepID=UPI00038A4CF1|nr:hypothetical protein [Clostridium sp. BL8]EQB87206.1 hypothetical protein M918_10135 [Clostridium sp. BL8]